MKKSGLILVLTVAIVLVCSIVVVFAEDSMSNWPFFAEITPRQRTAGVFDFNVPFEVMDKARADLADLRIVDGQNREIPYALRIRKDVSEKREISTREFNRTAVGKNTSELSVDLGENAGEHNEIEVDTAGVNFRRRVELEGSDSGIEWRSLKTGDLIFSFTSQNKSAESNRIGYPTSRYRYLRVRVFADEMSDDHAPEISGVKVVMSVHEKGVQTDWHVSVSPQEFVRNQGTPATAWNMDLWARVPCDSLALEVGDESFSRPFQLEAIDDPQNIRLLASGELTRRIGEPRRPLTITFDNEVRAQKLRLVITDFNNQPLTISDIIASAPARQLIYSLKEPPTLPLRLFFGNPKAAAPHYDFERNLDAALVSQPVASDLGAGANNPVYRPEPKPLTERNPWLIYVVLAASGLALAFVLLSLARTTLVVGGVSKEKQSPSQEAEY